MAVWWLLPGLVLVGHPYPPSFSRLNEISDWNAFDTIDALFVSSINSELLKQRGFDNMCLREPTSSGDKAEESKNKTPLLTSLQDLTILEAWDPENHTSKYITFYVVTPDEEVYFGQSSKKKREMTLAEYQAALERVEDDEIYPACPAGVDLTIAPEHLDDSCAYIKRPGLYSYEEMKGTDFIPKSVLDETLIMEQISKTPHPHIVKYHGCRVRRGRITAIVLEQLDSTLTQYVLTPAFQSLEKARFLEALEFAVDYLHSLGLAHNDINPDNIMVRDGLPVLIDFGSCAPYGARLQSLGTPGWCEETFFTSEEKHDAFSLRKLREWLDDPR